MAKQTEHRGDWTTFFGMIATSTIVMFFLMYQLVYEPSHLYFSLNRFLSSLASGAVMTIVMLGFMWRMYGPRRTKLFVTTAAVIAAVALLFVNRTQALISDETYMESMIPHHSIAINNSRKASISDPRVREMADDIIAAQVKEIAQMELLLEDIQANGEMGDGSPLPPRTAELTPELLQDAKAAVGRPLGPDAREEVSVGE